MKKTLAIVLNTLLAVSMAAAQSSNDAPKVYLTYQSRGNTWGAVRDQSQEMAKDFAKKCPDLKLTGIQADADYHVGLNHIEAGLARDNQLAVTDIVGNVLKTVEKGSVKGGVQEVCAVILADWLDQAKTRQKIIRSIELSSKKEGTVAYAEISGDEITVHSERASSMRFHMAVANLRFSSMLRHAGLVKFLYTDDADQSFAYDVKSGKMDESLAQGPSGTTAPPNSSQEAAASAPLQVPLVQIAISSVPDAADIEIDGGFVGNTPSAIEIAPGEHTVVVHKKGFNNWERKIKVSGGSVSLRAELDPLAP